MEILKNSEIVRNSNFPPLRNLRSIVRMAAPNSLESDGRSYILRMHWKGFVPQEQTGLPEKYLNVWRDC